MTEYETNKFVDSLSDDEFMTMSAIGRESSRIREIKPSKDERKRARDLFVHLNKEILPLLENSNEPLTILCFSDSRNEFTFLMGYQHYSAPFKCYNSTLRALKALYEGTMPASCDATIIPIPVQEPGHGVKLYLSLTFGINK